MKTGKKAMIKILMVLLGALLVVVSVGGCGEEAPKEPIVFADLGWDSALVHNQIAGFILENGYAVLEGTREELMDNPDVRAAYFGV